MRQSRLCTPAARVQLRIGANGGEPGGAKPKFMAVAALVAAMAASTTALAADKLVLQLHGPAQFEFAGYYAALWQGFYSEAERGAAIRAGAGGRRAPTDTGRH